MKTEFCRKCDQVKISVVHDQVNIDLNETLIACGEKGNGAHQFDPVDKIFYVDHFAPNEYHKTTGFYLLWTYLADGDVDLVDWALYSPEPGQGLSKIDAENKVITTGQKLGGKVELRKPI